MTSLLFDFQKLDRSQSNLNQVLLYLFCFFNEIANIVPLDARDMNESYHDTDN